MNDLNFNYSSFVAALASSRTLSGLTPKSVWRHDRCQNLARRPRRTSAIVHELIANAAKSVRESEENV